MDQDHQEKECSCFNCFISSLESNSFKRAQAIAEVYAGYELEAPGGAVYYEELTASERFYWRISPGAKLSPLEQELKRRAAATG